jgi:hypothetical protein
MARPWNELGRYGGVGIDLVLAILLLGALGHWIDGRYYGRGHDTWMMVGGLLGVVVGIRNLVRAAARMQKDIEAAEAKDPEAGKWKVDPGWLHDSDDARESPRDEPPR